MAVNLKNKKTTLQDNASIYAKRNEDESEKSKWEKMDGQQKRSYFASYYLRPLIIGCVVALVIGFFVYKDVIMKKDVIYRCAVMNEMALEVPIQEFSDGFVESMGLDIGKNTAVFSLYYSNTEIAEKVGAALPNDLTQVSAMIYAATLDSIIAGKEDFDGYMENKFFTDLTEILSVRELALLEDRLYIPDTAENAQGKPYGIRLSDNEVYQQMFQGSESIAEDPVFGVIFNSENKEVSKQFLYYLFPELKE